ncbi:MAG: hypothetical protein MJE77_09010 [Proteobacteria bacterium]|nr:hypothetical protein [Pseudomonadota bacterium]
MSKKYALVATLLITGACDLAGESEPDLTGTWVQRGGCEQTFTDGDRYNMLRYEFAPDGETYHFIFSFDYIDDTCTTVAPDDAETAIKYYYRLGDEIRASVFEIDVTAAFDEEVRYLALKVEEDRLAFSVRQGEDSIVKGEDGTTASTRARSVFGFDYLKQN